MAINIPSILLHPNKLDYSIDNMEINYLKDAKTNLLKKYYSLTIKDVWKAVLNNLRRRIENFGSTEFIDSLYDDEKNIYFKHNNTFSEKLSLINHLTLIRQALTLRIINEKTYSVLDFFYWFSKSSSTETIYYEDVISIITLLEKNFFKLRIDYVARTLSNTNSTDELLPKEEETLQAADLTVQRRRKEDIEAINPQELRRRRSDYIKNPAATKKLKKEDLYFIQQQNPKNRKDDFQALAFKRRKDDIQESPKRRKDDFKNQTPRRRQDDL